MGDQTDALDRADDLFLTYTVSDEALEAAAAGMAGSTAFCLSLPPTINPDQLPNCMC